MTETQLRNEMVKFVVECYPEYRGRLLFGIGELAKMFTKGNADKMREIIHLHAIPCYKPVDSFHKGYFLVEVFDAVYHTKVGGYKIRK